jgi:hypothetical protein
MGLNPSSGQRRAKLRVRLPFARMMKIRRFGITAPAFHLERQLWELHGRNRNSAGLGKSVLIANAMAYLRRFDTAPMIQPVLGYTLPWGAE